MQSIRPVKIEWQGTDVGYLSGARYKWISYAPANATATLSSLALF